MLVESKATKAHNFCPGLSRSQNIGLGLDLNTTYQRMFRLERRSNLRHGHACGDVAQRHPNLRDVRRQGNPRRGFVSKNRDDTGSVARRSPTYGLIRRQSHQESRSSIY